MHGAKKKNVKFTRMLEMFFVTNMSVSCVVGGRLM